MFKVHWIVNRRSWYCGIFDSVALVVLQSPPRQTADPVSVVISIDGNGDCVQARSLESGSATIQNGQQVRYTTASGSND